MNGSRITRPYIHCRQDLKKSAPVHTTMIKLIIKYYQQSKNLPKNEKKWFYRKIEQFTDWNMLGLQKWLRTANRIIYTKNIKMKRKKGGPNWDSTIMNYNTNIKLYILQV